MPWVPVIAASDSTQMNRRTLQIARNGLFALVVLGSLLAILAPWIVPLLYGEAFRPAVYVIWAVVPGLVLIHPYRTFAIDSAGRGKQIMPILSAGAGMLVNATCCWILIPMEGWYGGIVGAGLAMTISAFVMTVITIVLFQQRWKTSVREMLILTREDIAGYRKRIHGLTSRLKKGKDGLTTKRPSDSGRPADGV